MSGQTASAKDYPRLREILKASRETAIERFIAWAVTSIPAYARIDRSTLRMAAEMIFDAIIRADTASQKDAMVLALIGVSEMRAAQGVGIGDFIRAVQLTFPVVREILRDAHANDSPFHDEFAALERDLQEITSRAAEVYAEAMQKQLSSKNRELNLAVQKLRAEERSLSREVKNRDRALEMANVFNQRVVESLNAGVLVLDENYTVTLYSQQLERMIGVPAEEVLGHVPSEVIKRLGGQGFEELLQLGRKGRIPGRKADITLPGNRRVRWFVRAEPLMDDEGEYAGLVMVIDDVTERDLLIETFSRYVSRDLVERVLATQSAPTLEGEERDLSILFADIRGFTRLAETHDPHGIHEILNTYLGIMVDAVERAGGFVDKFVGDKVMGVFRGSRDAASTAVSAVKAAVMIQQRVTASNVVRVAEGKAPIHVGIGVNTGPAVLGNIGSSTRMDFTVIGDTVNVADRLQGLAMAGEVVVGGRTASLAAPHYPFEAVVEHSVKGREKPVAAAHLRVVEVPQNPHMAQPE